MSTTSANKCRFPPCGNKKYNTQEFCHKHNDVLGLFTWFMQELEKAAQTEQKTDSGLVIPKAG